LQARFTTVLRLLPGRVLDPSPFSSSSLEAGRLKVWERALVGLATYEIGGLPWAPFGVWGDMDNISVEVPDIACSEGSAQRAEDFQGRGTLS
jgi:hypothetical protein